MKGIIYVFFFALSFNILSCNIKKRQYIKEKEEQREFKRSNTRFFISIQDFHLVPCREFSREEHISITDKYINYFYGDRLVVLDSTSIEVNQILDSIELQLEYILNNIKPAYYDCKELNPKDQQAIGEPTRYVNFGKSFYLSQYSEEKRVEKDKWFLGIDTKSAKYHIFECHSEPFINLITLINKLITISIENKGNQKSEAFFLINEPAKNNCECKEFEIGRIFKEEKKE
jgi:hypothetical protein